MNIRKLFVLCTVSAISFPLAANAAFDEKSQIFGQSFELAATAPPAPMADAPTTVAPPVQADALMDAIANQQKQEGKNEAPITVESHQAPISSVSTQQNNAGSMTPEETMKLMNQVMEQQRKQQSEKANSAGIATNTANAIKNINDRESDAVGAGIISVAPDSVTEVPFINNAGREAGVSVVIPRPNAASTAGAVGTTVDLNAVGINILQSTTSVMPLGFDSNHNIGGAAVVDPGFSALTAPVESGIAAVPENIDMPDMSSIHLDIPADIQGLQDLQNMQEMHDLNIKDIQEIHAAVPEDIKHIQEMQAVMPQEVQQIELEIPQDISSIQEELKSVSAMDDVVTIENTSKTAIEGSMPMPILSLPESFDSPESLSFQELQDTGGKGE